jgi:hypothetical protein
MLPDVTCDQLKKLTEFWDQPNNNYTLTAMINSYYNDMIRHQELAKMEKERKANEEKRANESVGEASTEPTDRDNGQGPDL